MPLSLRQNSFSSLFGRRICRTLNMLAGILFLFCAGCSSVKPLNQKISNAFHFNRKQKTATSQAVPPNLTYQYLPSAKEMHGIWIATFENLDFPVCTDAKTYRTTVKKMMQGLQKKGINAIFFQVRPQCDAFYPSAINPWSHWLTGREGYIFPGLDPLRCLIDEAHSHGISLHAWLNPYRVTKTTRLKKQNYLNTLDPKNFARRHPEYVLEIPIDDKESTLILDPGEPLVRRHIVETVYELAINYPIDGIHFDDYFYPYHTIKKQDQASYKKYNPKEFSLGDWRRNNTAQLLWDIRQTLNYVQQQQQRKILFGVSCFGIWANKKHNPLGSDTNGEEGYYTTYTDSRLWLKNGMLDYLAPLVYWTRQHPKAPYETIVRWWAEEAKNSPTRIYIGLGLYQPAPDGKFGWDNPLELKNQLLLNQNIPQIHGEIYFSAKHLLHPDNPVKQKAIQNIWGKK